MKPLFELGDFNFGMHDASEKEIVDQANVKLQKLIDEAPVVYSYDGVDDWFKPTEQDYPNVRFKAKLLCVEQIKIKCEKHEPKFMASHKGMLHKNTCGKCGVEIESTWSERK